ncbi:MAG: UDP-glucose 4-epimerase GalE [Bacteroidales bacterium]|jgi:UDP-glucose 4-epimerase|nr:UDP-glucose 4-epimerase GalE [Bacteroidales bacterium]
MNKVMVTGGMGYIGSHTIIELLKSSKYQVVSVDSCERSTPETAARIEQITGIRVINERIDICDKKAFFEVFERHADIVGIIHFAAYKSVPESVEQPLAYYRNNLGSLENVLEACRKFGIPNLIFSSSCSIYGEVAQLPVTEETPTGVPFCPYAHTKQIGEEMIRFVTQAHPELQTVILRYFNPVGSDMSGLNGELSPDQPNNLMPIITQVAIGKREGITVFGHDYATRDGSCIRDYVHVSDIAEAHVLALDFLQNGQNRTNCEIFNLGSGDGITVLEMLHAFEQETGLKLNYAIGPRRAGDVPAIYSDSRRAQEKLGWLCRHSLKDMVTSAWAWELHLNS